MTTQEKIKRLLIVLIVEILVATLVYIVLGFLISFLGILLGLIMIPIGGIIGANYTFKKIDNSRIEKIVYAVIAFTGSFVSLLLIRLWYSLLDSISGVF